MFKRLTVTVNNQLKSYDLTKLNKLVRLKGTEIDKNSILYAFERALAEDFSTYYNKLDNECGVEYTGNIEKLTLETSVGDIIFASNKIVKKMTTKRNFHCIRYITDGRIRSFITPQKNDINVNNIGVSLLEYSSILSLSSWVRLEVLFNKTVGYKAISFNKTSKELKFDLKEINDWSIKSQEIAYLILSESFMSARSGMRVLLLSEIKELNKSCFSELLKSISSISNNFEIIFCNDADNTLNYKVLSL